MCQYFSLDDEDDTFGEEFHVQPNLEERDLFDGPRLRMQAYHSAWKRCHKRIQVSRFYLW